MKNVVMYHSQCFDGTMAAAGALNAAEQGRLEGLILFSITYSQATQEVFFGKGGPYEYVSRGGLPDKFHFVDFCPKPEVIQELSRLGHEVVILDHHKTAQHDANAVRGLPGVDLRFDMGKSGARLSWEYFNGEVPELALYVEDRDLWAWKKPHTKEVIAWMSAVTTKNEPESYLAAIGEFKEDPGGAIQKGTLIVEEISTQVKTMADRFRLVELEGFGTGAIVNAPIYQSEVCDYVSANNQVPFVIAYGIGKDGKVPLSLRSRQGADWSVDVSEMAKQFNGGGHANASGGVTTLEVLFDLLSFSEGQPS